MSTIIELITTIRTPIEVCFNLSRSVELHKISTCQTNENVIDGRTSGLFQMNDTVTWRARHFGFYQHLQMKITALQYPFYFQDSMLKGIFKSISHQHYFEHVQAITVMRDVFEYSIPFGAIGNWFDKLILKNYMTKLLNTRNETIKHFAESGKWESVPGLLV